MAPIGARRGGAGKGPGGGTRVVATHDLELILRTCGRVLLLDRGRLCADGPAPAVLADAALMEVHGLEVPHSLR